MPFLSTSKRTQIITNFASKILLTVEGGNSNEGKTDPSQVRSYKADCLLEDGPSCYVTSSNPSLAGRESQPGTTSSFTSPQLDVDRHSSPNYRSLPTESSQPHESQPDHTQPELNNTNFLTEAFSHSTAQSIHHPPSRYSYVSGIAVQPQEAILTFYIPSAARSRGFSIIGVALMKAILGG